MSTFREPFDLALQTLTRPGSPFELVSTDFGAVHYPSVLCKAPQTLIELIQPGRAHGDAEFIVFEGRRWTFNEFFSLADRLCHQMVHQFDIQPGDHVAIAMRNYPEWLVAFVAAAYAGAVIVPLNSWWLGEELRFSLQFADVKLIVCDHRRAELIQPAELGMTAIVMRADDVPLPAASWCGETLIQAAADVPAEQLTPDITLDPESLAMIIFTSGTSGQAKGAEFLHRCVGQAVMNAELGGACSFMTNSEPYQQHAQRTPVVRTLLAVPLFHVSGLVALFLLTLRGGRSLVMMYKWDAGKACELIDQEQISVVVGAPSMLFDMVRHPDFDSIDRSHLINISVGGAATPRKLLDMLWEKVPGALTGAGWGMTESAAVGAAFTGRFMKSKPSSSGFLSPIVEMKFCDENEGEVPSGAPGEIWVKSPASAIGYYKNGQATRETFHNGWLRTGDVGYLDEEGCLYICDRVKDMVNRSGENIYPIEVENCLQSMPGVEQVAAFGIPSEQHGEELAVVIKTHGPGVSESLIKEFCRQHLAHFKVPSAVCLTDEQFPLNSSGKVMKNQLRKQLFGV